MTPDHPHLTPPTKRRRWVWIALAWLVAVIIALPLGVVGWLHGNLPAPKQTLSHDRLSSATTVFRDDYSIGHIFAGHYDDALFALGFLHAQDRLWQMDMSRRVGRGTLSEVIGSATLGIDRFMRTLQLTASAERDLFFLSEEELGLLESYRDGINAFLAQDPVLSPEFLLLGYRPDPWENIDSLLIGKIMALSLSADFSQEIARARIVEDHGLDLLSTLLPEVDIMPVSELNPYAAAAGMVRWHGDDPVGALTQHWHGHALTGNTASNVFAVTGSRSKSGRPILANDTHLELSTPAVWYLTGLHTPTHSIVGATMPGIPAVLIGHNRHLAWGITATHGDQQDLFIERLDGDGRVLTPTGAIDLVTFEEVIAIKGQDPETLTVRVSPHGPLISDVMDLGTAPDVAIALSFVPLKDVDTTARTAMKMGLSPTIEFFVELLTSWTTPHLNFVLADTQGRLAFQVAGTTPKRLDGDGFLPKPGWVDTYDWQGWVSFEQLPNIPPGTQTLIMNANENINTQEITVAHTFEAPYRAQRLAELLAGPTPIGMDEAQAIQLDHVSLAARVLLTHLIDTTSADQTVTDVLLALRLWDQTMDPDRPEPLIFMIWMIELAQHLYGDELGEAAQGLDHPNPTVLDHLMRYEPVWCDDVTTERNETCDDIAMTALRDTLDTLTAQYGRNFTKWRWGDRHKAPQPHTLFSRVPILAWLTDESASSPGGPFTLNRGDIDEDLRHTHGAALRVIFDLADLDRSRFIIAGGQSGNVLSRHDNDQLELWREGAMIEMAKPQDYATTTRPPMLLFQPTGQ
ncbi:MAG: penicillin acylase family protein [Pseudomonadota bacterium]